jgi:hypothetical protein
MKLTFLITVITLVVGTMVGSLFPSVIMVWMLVTFLTSGYIALIIIVTSNFLKEWQLLIGWLLAISSLIFLSISSLTTLYIGYGLAIFGQILLFFHQYNLENDSSLLIKKGIGLLVLTLVLEFIGFVIVPPNPVSIPLMLMMLLISFLIINGSIALLGQATNSQKTSFASLIGTYLFFGLYVLNGAFNSGTIMTFLLNLPWHLGVMFLLFAIILFTYGQLNLGLSHG